MSKCLITGCGGFIGSYLAEYSLQKDIAVYGVVHHGAKNLDHLKEKITLISCDIQDKDSVKAIVAEVKPDIIFHLAAESQVEPSNQNFEKTFSINTLGTLHLLEAVRQAGITPVIGLAGSSAEYGPSHQDEVHIDETHGFRPSSLYAVSKAAADMLGYFYWKAYHLPIIRVRLFNITGPGRIGDACSDFTRGIVESERERKNKLEVGNLEAVRDFTDVRDGVKALWRLIERATPGEAYNLCSGRGYSIKQILDMAISLSSHKIQGSPRQRKLRFIDDPVYIGDNSKLRKLGWEPQIPLEKTLADMLEYWRRQI
jgi:GDP-4-dehydro-6-deoxy-D-mannose reductase